ncbi:MFS transporter [Burkholderia gladioli]|uniref:MFS transporter n=1 Tax=Burkholderia gladioli TaxID=28095 RepID=UPI00163FF4E3|nr:MFS transporter [Burkholderia gladioli]
MYIKLSGLLLGNLAVCSNALIVTALLVPLGHAFQLTEGQATSFAFVYGLAYAGIAPFTGVLTTPFPRHRVALGGIVVFIAGCAVSACAGSPMVLLVGRVLTAVGAVLFTPIASDLAASVEPARRGQAISYVYLGLGGATLLGMTGAMWLATSWSWRMAFVSSAATAIVAGGLVLVMAWPPRKPSGSQSEWPTLLRDPRIIVSLSSTFTLATAEYSLYTFASAYLTRVSGLFITSTTSALMVFGMAGIAGGIAGGLATDRFGSHRILWLSPTVLLVSNIALFAVHRSGEVFCHPRCVGLAAYSFQAPQQTRLLSMAPNARSAILSFNSTANCCGISAGAALGGLIVDRLGLHALPGISAAIALAALLSCFPATLSNPVASSRHV